MASNDLVDKSEEPEAVSSNDNSWISIVNKKRNLVSKKKNKDNKPSKKADMEKSSKHDSYSSGVLNGSIPKSKLNGSVSKSSKNGINSDSPVINSIANMESKVEPELEKEYIPAPAPEVNIWVKRTEHSVTNDVENKVEIVSQKIDEEPVTCEVTEPQEKIIENTTPTNAKLDQEKAEKPEVEKNVPLIAEPEKAPPKEYVPAPLPEINVWEKRKEHPSNENPECESQNGTNSIKEEESQSPG